ncbi:hypothetical protein N9917_01210 [Deltaproteobacteria bacterium]|nr:hypothetical protein [Deltaproteobacteria bacterium]
MTEDTDNTKLKDMIKRVHAGIRVTKVTATRSVKGKGGDSFAGFSAAWDTVQDDVSGPGADSELTVSDAVVSASGMTLAEAKVAHYLCAMQADIAAHEAAMAGGGISPARCKDTIKGIKGNYARLIRNAVNGSNGTSKE